MKEKEFLDIGQAITQSVVNGKPFRHISMRPRSPDHPESWLEITKEGMVHVIGPDDIMPFDEALPMEWRVGKVFEVKE